MPREGRFYYQYLEFITWEELPLPSPARQLGSHVHPRKFRGLLGRLKRQEMKQCHKVQNWDEGTRQENCRAELRESRLG